MISGRHIRTTKDINCLRLDRTVDAYRRVSLHNRPIAVNHATPGDTLNVRFYRIVAAPDTVRFVGHPASFHIIGPKPSWVLFRVRFSRKN